MEFTSLLIVIGTFISIYQISEDHKKRNFIFKFSSYDLILLVIIFLLFLYYLVVESYIVSLKENEMYVVPQIYGLSCSFLIVVAVLFLIIATSLYVIYKLNSNEIIRKEEFIKNLQTKFNEKKYDVIITDLWIYYESFNTKSSKTLSVPLIFCKISNIKKSLKRKYHTIRVKLQTVYKNLVLYLQQIWNTVSKKEKTNDQENLLNNFFNTILINKEFICEVFDKNPLLALKLLDSEFVDDKTFVWSLYGEYLIQNKNSLFYRELNEHFTGKKYLLNFLLDDVNKCSDLLAWRPIGEQVIEYIKNQRRKDLDYENFIEDTYEEKKWESPIYNGIVFFDQMVNKALKQNFKDHMWLFYLNHFVKEILENISYYDEKEEEKFKNMYEYYLFSIFYTYKHWIRYIETKNYDVELDNDSAQHQNENIIKSSIISMTRSLNEIANSSKLRPKFKLDFGDIYLKLYFDFAISHQKEQNDYSNVIMNCLKDRLSHYNEKNDFWNLLYNAFDNFDLISLKLGKDDHPRIEEITEKFRIFLEEFSPNKG